MTIQISLNPVSTRYPSSPPPVLSTPLAAMLTAVKNIFPPSRPRVDQGCPETFRSIYHRTSLKDSVSHDSLEEARTEQMLK